MSNCSTYVIDKHIEEEGSQERFLMNNGKKL
jgi:hypothetical protein